MSEWQGHLLSCPGQLTIWSRARPLLLTFFLFVAAPGVDNISFGIAQCLYCIWLDHMICSPTWRRQMSAMLSAQLFWSWDISLYQHWLFLNFTYKYLSLLINKILKTLTETSWFSSPHCMIQRFTTTKKAEGFSVQRMSQKTLFLILQLVLDQSWQMMFRYTTRSFKIDQ